MQKYRTRMWYLKIIIYSEPYFLNINDDVSNKLVCLEISDFVCISDCNTNTDLQKF